MAPRRITCAKITPPGDHGLQLTMQRMRVQRRRFTSAGSWLGIETRQQNPNPKEGSADRVAPFDPSHICEKLAVSACLLTMQS